MRRWIGLAKLVALLAFVLPWMTVSCANTVLVRASGWALATGRIDVLNPVTGATERSDAQPNGWLIAALVLIAIGLVAIAAAQRGGIAAALTTSLAALACVVVGTHRYGSEAMTEAARQHRAGEAVEQFAQGVRVDWQVGYWLELVALAAAAGMAGASLARRAPPG